MDLSSNRSQDEDRVMQRQLYRAGQPQPAPKTLAAAPSPFRPSSPPAAKSKYSPGSGNGKPSAGQSLLPKILLLGFGYYLLYGTPSQRKKVYIGLGVAVWLLFLGSMSYCLCSPDLEEISREMNQARRAVFEDPNLTPEQRREKFRELDSKMSKLTPSQRRQVFQISRKEMIRKGNASMHDFLSMSPAEQVAQLKKEAAEWEKRRQQWAKMRANGGPRGNRGGNGKGNGKSNGKGGGNGSGGGGRPGGFGGGGGGGGASRDISRLDSGQSPESRAGGAYKWALRGQAGLNSGFGRGGPGGGKGGGGGGRGR